MLHVRLHIYFTVPADDSSAWKMLWLKEVTPNVLSPFCLRRWVGIIFMVLSQHFSTTLKCKLLLSAACLKICHHETYSHLCHAYCDKATLWHRNHTHPLGRGRIFPPWVLHNQSLLHVPKTKQRKHRRNFTESLFFRRLHLGDIFTHDNTHRRDGQDALASHHL